MQKNIHAFVIGFSLLLGLGSYANAAVIGFEDLTTRNNFNALGISDTYHGFEWGYGFTAATPIWTNSHFGWASGITPDSSTLHVPAGGILGQSFAWTWSGPLSLWIDFKSLMNFDSGYFGELSPVYSLNSTSVQFFGYNAAMSLVGTSAVMTLTDTLTLMYAGLTGIQFLEIRGSADDRWFAVDNLSISPSAIPLPAALPLFAVGLGLLGFVGWRRKRKASI